MTSPRSAAAAAGHLGAVLARLAGPDASPRDDQVDAVYAKSIHGMKKAAGNKFVASCTDCHGMHNIFPPKDPRSLVYPLNLPETCGKCHGNLELIKKASITVPSEDMGPDVAADPYSRYKQSVHGQAVLKSGLVVSAVCNDCHVPHTLPEKYIVKADNGWNHSKKFTLQNFKEPIRIRPANLVTLQHNCLHCHATTVSEIASHKELEAKEIGCTTCHRSVGHMSLD